MNKITKNIKNKMNKKDKEKGGKGMTRFKKNGRKRQLTKKDLNARLILK